jgi:hypothetical protein
LERIWYPLQVWVGEGLHRRFCVLRLEGAFGGICREWVFEIPRRKFASRVDMRRGNCVVCCCGICIFLSCAEVAHTFVRVLRCTLHFPLLRYSIPPIRRAVRFRNRRSRSHFVMSEVKIDADSAFDAQTPLLDNMVVGVPPVFESLTKQLDKIVEQPLLGPKTKFPAGQETY